MSFFRELDLYKVIILLSVVLVPAALGFVYWVGGQIDVAERALHAAERRDGEIEKIGALQRQLETVEKNASSARSSGGLHSVFFEQQIDTASAGTLKKTDYEISPEQRVSAAAQQKAQDQEVTISFRRDRNNPMNLPRDFIHAVIFNIESSGAQVWKLRQLKIRNAALGRSKEAPPKTVDDLWDVQTLKFARREPSER